MNLLGELPALLFFLIALVAFLESFALLGVFVPGVVFLFSLSALANTSGFGPIPVMIAGALGAIIGDISSFLIGHKLQNKVSDWRWFKRHQSWLDQGEWFIRRWGWASVIVGRFLGPLRPVIPLAAGTLGMPTKQFIPLSLFTVVFWAPAYMLPGYYTGELSELWQIQPLSNRSLIKYALTAIAVSAGAIAIYHHAHPERWHLKGWISRHQADHWPFASLLLVFISLCSTILLMFFLPETQNVQFSMWAVTWRQDSMAPLWHSLQSLSNTGLITILLFALTAWLELGRHSRLALLTVLIGLFSYGIASLATGYLAPATENGEFVDFTLLSFLCTFIAMLMTSGMHSLKRWPIYFSTSLVIVLFAVSQLWEGALRLVDTGIAVGIALGSAGILRATWRILHLPQAIPKPHSMLLLIFITCIAAARLSFVG